MIMRLLVLLTKYRRIISSILGLHTDVRNYGAVSGGVTDATAAFQAAVDAVNASGGGVVRFDGNYLIDSNLNVPDSVTIRGPLGLPGMLKPVTTASYESENGVLIINSAATITFGDSAGISNCMVIRKGLDLPFADATAAAAGVSAFSGTALTVGGIDVYFGYMLILGFAQAISSDSYDRIRCEYISGDNTSGISLVNTNDTAYLDNCHFWPFTTANQSWSSGTLNARSGTAYNISDIGAWNKITNCFEYGYAVGFVSNNCDNVHFICCGADNNSALVATSKGFVISGTSKDNMLINCESASQGTGVEVNVTAATGNVLEITGGNIINCDTYSVNVLDGRCALHGTKIRNCPTGVNVDTASDGVIIDGVTFDTVTTPMVFGGNSRRKSQVWGNDFIYCSDTVGHQLSSSGSLASIDYIAANADAIGVAINARCSRGTIASPTINLASDVAFSVKGQLYDGSAYVNMAKLRCQANGSPAAGSVPGAWVLSTTTTNTLIDRVAVDSAGDWYPVTDNAYRLGRSGARWSEVWSVNGTIQTSDMRDKTDILDNELGIDFINQLKPVSFKWKSGITEVTRQIYYDTNGNEVPEGVTPPDDATPGEIMTISTPGERRHWGLLAQDVKQTCDNFDVDFGGWVLTDVNDPDSQQALRYDQFISPLIKAVQDLSKEVDQLKSKIYS